MSAPSGSGKSTIISNLINDPCLSLAFSISATSRQPRGKEQHGREYFFLTEAEFKEKVANGEFVEWEEVYPGVCYGTLESEIQRITDAGMNVIMDVDVKGGLNLKKRFGEKALTLFIMPPDLNTLEERLKKRATDSPDTIAKRLKKAEYEMSFAQGFDTVVINDNLELAVEETRKRIKGFISLKQ